MDNILIFVLVDFLHNLFTVFWIGGQIVLLLIILPAVKNTLGKNKESKNLLRVIKNRMSIGVYICLIGFAVTGLMMTHRAPLASQIISFENNYSILLSLKHFIFIGMVAISLFRSRLIDMFKLEMPKKEKINVLLLVVNVLLGISVLLLSSYLGVLSSIAE